MKFIKNKLAVTIVILSVTFLILIGYSIKRNKVSIAESSAGKAINSVQGVFYKTNKGIKNFFYVIFNYSDIKSEYEELKLENEKLKDKELAYDTLKEENNKLREMLNFKRQAEGYEYVGCDIIGKSGGVYLDGFTINKGLKDGIEKQMIAVTNQGLVGQVISVGRNWAVVQTLSNENMAVSAIVQSTRENMGVVKGFKDSNNNQLAKLYYLPLESKIKKNDVILTSGLDGGLYPKGIKIGYVIDIEEDKGKVMKNAVIQPYVNFSKLEEVFIVVPKEKLNIKN
ncbi:rod shape-determining protein MreC [Clostridium cochlearium]|jgi:rod shape-determining protein MreC|uniref:Cell shape-determining protein MreC n=3 Tax=Clostridium cochlearium TaxID=1494 RepID=A0A240API2_CLOCO|nr:rod shape-determining protein MreC [Clostridium cochlearium]MBV1817208.1 rod shape-determining protein MreC [Bacteroidales bacterium MSK.15.36]NSJ91059.1 rod shape-determining protein MreC [Coprococcus sp. MSK.21.13]MBE6064665.1 rod shape-determining protein MreC [Clostridium cochlearium]MBU5268384.1 rod shape-determining protein MreC [Clostridium cochlearium]MCG4571386.1 rod shape-determining protein MreC [Clostridium cochlearium]